MSILSPPQDAPTRGPSPAWPVSEIDPATVVARLRDCLTRPGGLFDRQLLDRAWAPTGDREAVTSTAIALIGLSRSGEPSASPGLDLGRTREALFSIVRARREPGPLGLAIWANAVTGGPPLAEALGDSIAGISGPPRRLRTMELAWLVSGLAHERHRSPSRRMDLALGTARDALIGRFHAGSGCFRHADADSPPLLRGRRWVATFADQIYPIQALALTSIGTGDARALDVAARAALRLAEAQGDRGQWWWHHDPRDGRVSGAYPVYSVHQHAMAPMALRTLAIAGGPDLGRAIEAGRAWLSSNELGVDLIDRQVGTIWRSIERDEGRASRLVRNIRERFGRGDDRPRSDFPPLRVNRETRPYEWGWHLHAGAIAAGTKPPEHLA